MEEVLGMTREYDSIATLWDTFHRLMRTQREDDTNAPALPGTGSHVLAATTDTESR